MSPLDPQRRQQLLEAVATWLDALPDAEPLPPGVAAEIVQSAAPTPDLFTLLGQLTALTRETQLQGRATNRLHAELSEKLEQIAANQLSADTVARQFTTVRREARLEIMTEILEVRDRFSRGLAEAQRRLQGGFWARFTPQRAVLTALFEGNTLARERLDDLLRRLDIQEIACLGKPFDPELMRATEVVSTTTVAPGTVLDVFRPGYTIQGRVLRFAEVRVAADSRS